MTLDDVGLSDLDEGQKCQAKQMLSPYSDMWSGRLGRASVSEHHIGLEPNTRLVFSQPYRAGHEARNIIQDQVNDLLDRDVIEPSTSPWASPVLLVPKSDGSKRFCVDYKQIHA
eukprot:IDg10141t1